MFEPLEPDDSPASIVDIDVRHWVESAANDPVLYRDRQVTEILLAAIGLSPTLREALVLKGGTLMALAFKSDRVTGDVDFTAAAEPEGFAELLIDELNRRLPKTAIALGYLDLICRVQSVKKMPKARDFESHDFPALLVRIGSARRGTGEERRLTEGQATRVLQVEVSFRDQVFAFQELNLADAGVAVRAFTVHEIVAEKLRALLQQPIRNRFRRQDVYDIAYLLETYPMAAEDRNLVYRTLVEKCRSRGIVPTDAAIDDPEIARRAEADWQTMALEVADLPQFEERFAAVRDFYLSLPWENQVTRS